MKKVLLSLTCLLLMSSVAFADETKQANQDMNIENNKAVIIVQKQPKDEVSTQKQHVKNNWFCIVVQVNGKVLYNKSDNQ